MILQYVRANYLLLIISLIKEDIVMYIKKMQGEQQKILLGGNIYLNRIPWPQNVEKMATCASTLCHLTCLPH